jgi:hypothetical protein
MYKARILRVVVISATDVKAEREAVRRIINYLNKSIAKDRGLILEDYLWETDAFPSFHPEGRQVGIDEVLRIEDCDLLVAIFWKRFGTPVRDARSGTEHEFLLALKHRREMGRPQIMTYFNQKPANPTTLEELEQWKRVLEFKKNFPEDGLYWDYEGEWDFEELLRNHITWFIQKEFPIPSESHPNPATVPTRNDPNMAAAPAREVELFIEGAVPPRLSAKHRKWLLRALSRLLDIPPSEVEIVSTEEVRASKLTINLPAPAAERLLKAYQAEGAELTRILRSFGVRAGRVATRRAEITGKAPVEANGVATVKDELDVAKHSTESKSLPSFGLLGMWASFKPPRLALACAALILLLIPVLLLFMQNTTRPQPPAELVKLSDPGTIAPASIADDTQTVDMYPNALTRGSDPGSYVRLTVSTATVTFLIHVPEQAKAGPCDLTLFDSESKIIFVMRGLECFEDKKIPIRVSKGAVPRGDYRFSLSRGQEFHIDYIFRIVRND